MTPREYLDSLCQLVPDEPISPGVPLEQLLTRSHFNVTDQLDAQAYGFDTSLTPRRQLAQVLKNTAMHRDAEWNGPEAIHDACRLAIGESPEVFGAERVARAHVFPLIARVSAMSILPEIALCQPHDRPASTTEGKFPAWHLRPFTMEGQPPDAGTDSVQRIQLRLAKTLIDAGQQKLHACYDLGDAKAAGDYHGLDVLVASVAREIALELNLWGLQKLLAGVRGAEEDCLARLDPADRTRHQVKTAVHALFKQCFGSPTHVIAGQGAWDRLKAAGLLVSPSSGSFGNPERFAGLFEYPGSLAGVSPDTKVFRTHFWAGVEADTLLLVRNLPHNLEGALAYCPHRWQMHRFADCPPVIRDQMAHEAALEVVEPAYAVKVRLD